MTRAEPVGWLERLAQRVEAETGLRFGAERWSELRHAVRRMAVERAAASPEAVAGWLLDGPWSQDKTDLCARYLTVGETYFFREPRALELLCEVARARLAADPRATLRLWSAGCCTGEEPYSMAIALRRALPALAAPQLSILATDLNPANLVHARAGLYREWAFRRIDPELRARYFSRSQDGRYLLARPVRAQVRFASLNLALPLYPSTANGTAGIDVIFCRNVLMYFSRALAGQVIARLRACLAEGGWLVVNPSEAGGEAFAGMRAVYHPDAVFYQKTGVADSPSFQPPVPAPARPVPPKLVHSPDDIPGPAAARRQPASPGPGALAGAAPESALAQAQALARDGDRRAALDCLERATERWLLEPGLYRTAAALALEQGMHGVARRHLQRLLYLEPTSAIGHYLDGIALAGLGNRTRARHAFGAAAALLEQLADDAMVPDADGWQAGTLLASVGTWLEHTP